MQLTLTADRLRIDLDGWERLWAFHWPPFLELPLSQIVEARLGEPASDGRQLRAPGAFLPGVIKSGTYYTPRGREFWYATRQGGEFLTLVLAGGEYGQVVLTLPEAAEWQARIQQAVSAVRSGDRSGVGA